MSANSSARRTVNVGSPGGAPRTECSEGAARVTVPISPSAAVDAVIVADISELRSVCTARISEPFCCRHRGEPVLAQRRVRGAGQASGPPPLRQRQGRPRRRQQRWPPVATAASQAIVVRHRPASGGAAAAAPRLRRSSSSNTPMPTSIAATKTSALTSPMPSATRPGPGQKPATPQPMPNSEAAADQAAVDVARRGQLHLGAEQGHRAPAGHREGDAAPTAMAPAMTKASEGSQGPARSRKPSTLAGLAMPETMRPSPKTRPASNEAKDKSWTDSSDAEQVARRRTRSRSRRP